MSHAEEQAQEIEVLESIYPDELTKISDTEYTIALTLDPAEPETESPIIIVHVEYPPTYPDVGPTIDLSAHPDSPDSPLDIETDKTGILEKLKGPIEENLGMSMVFTLVTEIKESAEDILRQRFAAKEAERERLLMIEEEKEMAKFRGTKVTKETFTEWATKFKKEMAEAKKERERLKEEEEKGRKGGGPAGINREKKLTGKQLFQQGLAVDVEDDGEGDAPDLEKLKIEA